MAFLQRLRNNDCRKMNVEVVFTFEGKTVSYFLVNALKFWEGVMCEFAEEELAKWVPDFGNLPTPGIYTDPNFIEEMWHICVHYGYVSQDDDALEKFPDLLKINNWV